MNEPVAWIRFCSDGCYEGPIMNAAMEDVRKKSGVWTPLYAQPPVQDEPPYPEEKIKEIAKKYAKQYGFDGGLGAPTTYIVDAIKEALRAAIAKEQS